MKVGDRVKLTAVKNITGTIRKININNTVVQVLWDDYKRPIYHELDELTLTKTTTKKYII